MEIFQWVNNLATLVPEIFYSYLLLFQPHFNKPSFVYFSGYMVSLLLSGGRKTMSRVAPTCFFVDRHLASWERFLAENAWDPTALGQTGDSKQKKQVKSTPIWFR